MMKCSSQLCCRLVLFEGTARLLPFSAFLVDKLLGGELKPVRWIYDRAKAGRHLHGVFGIGDGREDRGRWYNDSPATLGSFHQRRNIAPLEHLAVKFREAACEAVLDGRDAACEAVLDGREAVLQRRDAQEVLRAASEPAWL